jgi:hypothetical protein
MRRRWLLTLLPAVLGLAWLLGTPSRSLAQGVDPNRFYHYPYYYFPADYWPTMSPPWPEPPGTPYRPPPAYMAYPAFREPHWRYEWWQPQLYYRGSHFWLDQF